MREKWRVKGEQMNVYIFIHTYVHASVVGCRYMRSEGLPTSYSSENKWSELRCLWATCFSNNFTFTGCFTSSSATRRRKPITHSQYICTYCMYVSTCIYTHTSLTWRQALWPGLEGDHRNVISLNGQGDTSHKHTHTYISYVPSYTPRCTHTAERVL